MTRAQPSFLGECLTVEVTFLNIPVVTATLRMTEEVIGEDPAIYHLEVSTKSTPFYSLLYQVDNRYDSFFTWPEAHTLRYERCIRETGVDLRRVVSYQDGQAFYDGNLGAPVPSDVRDLFSALYALRGQSLEQDQVIDSPLDLDGQLWVARATVLGREEVRTHLGTHQTIKVGIRFLEPQQVQEERVKSDVLTNNLVRGKTKLTIWFSDDELKIPLRAQYRLVPFSLKAVLSTLD
jgi:hypothetical protein